MSSGFMLNINLGISMMRIFVLACSLFLSISVVADAAKIVLVAGSGKNPPPALATEVQLKGPLALIGTLQATFISLKSQAIGS